MRDEFGRQFQYVCPSCNEDVEGCPDPACEGVGHHVGEVPAWCDHKHDDVPLKDAQKRFAPIASPVLSDHQETVEIHRDKRRDAMKVIKFLNVRMMVASVKSREEAVEAAKGLSASEIVDAYIQAVRKL